MAPIRFQPADTDAMREELDVVLWEVLWRPLGLPRNIRAAFHLEGPSTELVALHQGRAVGGLVLTWLSDTAVELRHIAVLPAFQQQSLGRRLIRHGLRLLSDSTGSVLSTYARQTSVQFFQKLGFVALAGEVIEHPWFSKHGIYFQKMIYNLKSNHLRQPAPPCGVARRRAL